MKPEDWPDHCARQSTDELWKALQSLHEREAQSLCHPGASGRTASPARCRRSGLFLVVRLLRQGAGIFGGRSPAPYPHSQGRASLSSYFDDDRASGDSRHGSGQTLAAPHIGKLQELVGEGQPEKLGRNRSACGVARAAGGEKARHPSPVDRKRRFSGCAAERRRASSSRGAASRAQRDGGSCALQFRGRRSAAREVPAGQGTPLAQIPERAAGGHIRRRARGAARPEGSRPAYRPKEKAEDQRGAANLFSSRPTALTGSPITLSLSPTIRSMSGSSWSCTA